jgi:hypothetical protein
LIRKFQRFSNAQEETEQEEPIQEEPAPEESALAGLVRTISAPTGEIASAAGYLNPDGTPKLSRRNSLPCKNPEDENEAVFAKEMVDNPTWLETSLKEVRTKKGGSIADVFINVNKPKTEKKEKKKTERELPPPVEIDYVDQYSEELEEVFALQKILSNLDFADLFKDMDLYLIDNVFPALFPGLEELARQIERYQDPRNKIDANERSRFNPCLFLAEYLMRNNPKYQPESYTENRFWKYSESIRKTRHFRKASGLYRKHFMAENKQKELVTMRDMESMVKVFDQGMKLNGKLLLDMENNKTIIEHKEEKKDIKLDTFLKVFIKVAIENDSVKLQDLEDHEDVM